MTLDWMMAEARKCGLRFIPFDLDYVRTHQDAHGKLYDSRAGLGVYYRWDPRDITYLCREHHMRKPKIHISIFERIASGTDAYAPGNIPFECEVVTTDDSTNWPSSNAPERIAKLISHARLDHSSQAGSSLDTVRWAIVMGKASYYTFIAVTLLAAWLVYQPPGWLDFSLTIAGWEAPKLLGRLLGSLGILLVSGIVIRGWASIVDRKLDNAYQAMWNTTRRNQLREILIKNDRPIEGAQESAAHAVKNLVDRLRS